MHVGRMTFQAHKLQVAADVIGEEYLFIRAYRVGHTLKMDTIAVVVEARVKGGCYVFDEDGRIGGDGKGRWYGVLCPAEAEAELVATSKPRKLNGADRCPSQCTSGHLSAAPTRSIRQKSINSQC